MIFKKKEKIISGLYYQYFDQELVKDKLDKWSVSLRIMQFFFLSAVNSRCFVSALSAFYAQSTLIYVLYILCTNQT